MIYYTTNLALTRGIIEIEVARPLEDWDILYMTYSYIKKKWEPDVQGKDRAHVDQRFLKKKYALKEAERLRLNKIRVYTSTLERLEKISFNEVVHITPSKAKLAFLEKLRKKEEAEYANMVNTSYSAGY